MGEFVLWGLDAAARELTLFAAVGFLVGGVDDLLIDLAWLGHRLFGGSPRRALADLPAPPWPRALAVFIPAWDEAAVIGAMLRTALARIGHQRYRLYVGCYPNDPATIAVVTAVAAQDARVRLVIGPRPGPTTKADNLNALWRALRADDDAAGMATRAVVLHDAEDVVHPAELSVYDALIDRHPLIQIPVLPLIDPAARLVSGHYADEFAESHGRLMVVRAAIGAGLPLSGVGCAIATEVLEALEQAHGAPFDYTSLTEDYELCRDQDKESYAEQEIISSRTRKHRRNLQKAALKGWIRVRDLGGCNSQRGACRQVHPRCFQSTATSFLEEPSWRRLRL